ncbi:thermopsin family protease [Stygiolobus caldivivus]|uniref:Thermopsin n=1 Tax=Stygiolobus caldivivus TaxID=2824673 RepID=A0A8D5U628_9CREN|nr:thermopsin family protease [Stygiolobus caldivivus]BCU70181.1 thermopsin [Stygiolobus caldivivus]
MILRTITSLLIIFTICLESLYLPLYASNQALVPKQYTQDPPYFPMGVSSIGETDTGISIPVETHSVLGYARIQQISVSSASLQFNVVLVVTSPSTVEEFWVQNAIQFNGGQMRFIDNVWNFTSPDASMNPNVVEGNGHVVSEQFGNAVISFYTYCTNYNTYTLPMDVLFFTNVTHTAGGAVIKLGYDLNGDYTTYDVVSIGIPNINNAYILVAPEKTGSGDCFDVELVWGGFSNSQTATFQSLTSQLAIYYKVEGKNLYSPFPAVYNFGRDTGDTASNLQSFISNNGMVCVTTGTPNPEYLTSYFMPDIPGWTMVTVFSPKYYLVNGYNTTANNGYNPSQTDYGLPYFTSYTYPSQIQVVLPTFMTTFYRYTPQTRVTGTSNYNTSSTIIDLSNGNYILFVTYLKIPNLLRVTINIPMWGVVNGTPELIKSGEYYYGEVIKLPPYNYTQISPDERYLLIPNVTCIVVRGNISIHVTEVLQYLLNVNTDYPLTVVVNGVNETISGSQWFNSSETVKIPGQYYYVSKGQREMLLNPTVIVLNQPGIQYNASWVTQYLVLINSPLPVHEVVDGINETAPNIQWLNQSTTLEIPEQTYYSSGTERWVLTKTLEVTVNSPVNFTASWLLQYFVVLPRETLVEVNGTWENMSTGWVNNGTVITVPGHYLYLSKFERVAFYNTTPLRLTVNSSRTIIIDFAYQYYIKISKVIPGYVNGTLINVTSNWYNNGTVIKFKPSYYNYLSKYERIVCIPNTTELTVTSPFNLTVSLTKQYFVNVNSPFSVKALVRGQEVNFTTNWYESGCEVLIPRQYVYVNDFTRYVLVNNETVTISSHINFTAVWRLQYFVNVTSNYPAYALLNGHIINFTPSWYFNGSEVTVLTNITYPVSQGERYAVFSITPQSNFSVTKPESVKVVYYPQYYVVINGKGSWYFNGTTVTLEETVPYYLSVSWKGTYSLPNGAVVVVDKPINEEAVVRPNIINILTTLLIVVSAILLTIASLKRR